MNDPEIDPITAESHAQDADFATEHARPTFSDEPATEGPDESVPTGRGGDGGMDPPRRGLRWFTRRWRRWGR